MSCQLPFDCMDEIFEYFEKDNVTLYSCLLVNRLWCETSVKILWRNIWNFNYTHPRILNTLIACLPNKSKDLLHKKGIFISTSTSKPPLFNYASFFKALSTEKIHMMIEVFIKNIKNQQSTELNNNQNLLKQEILKMLMKQISSLKELTCDSDITFTNFPGARYCLTNLSTLSCSSYVHSELFFNQLSQICHNIQSLDIEFRYTISNGFKNLISSQNNLKYLSLAQSNHFINLAENLSPLMKHSKTLIKLKIRWANTLSFITEFTNLQELELYFSYYDSVTPFKELQYAAFPQLQILKFPCKCAEVKMVIKFLEINGKNLKEFYVIESDNSLNLAIARFCLSIKSLHTLFSNDQVSTLKIIFNSCQQLEIIESCCGGKYLNEEVILNIVAKHSPKNFMNLKLYNDNKMSQSESWNNFY